MCLQGQKLCALCFNYTNSNMAVLLNLEQKPLFSQGLPGDVKDWLIDHIGDITTQEETWWFNYEQLDKSLTRSQALKEVLRRIGLDFTNPSRYSTITTIVAQGWQFFSKNTFHTNTDFGVTQSTNAVLTIENEIVGLQFKLTWLC
jgi:hypothetical protein